MATCPPTPQNMTRQEAEDYFAYAIGFLRKHGIERLDPPETWKGANKDDPPPAMVGARKP